MKTTKEEILGHAAKLFFARGYEATTTKEIAVASGLANSSCLFNHFRNKEDIYLKVVEKYVINMQTPKQKFGDYEKMSLLDFIEFYTGKVSNTMKLLHQMMQSGDNTAIHYFAFYLEAAQKHKECAKAFLSVTLAELEMWETVIIHAQQTNEIRANVDARALAEMFRYTFLGVSYNFSVSGGITIEELKRNLYNIYNIVKHI